MKDICKLEKRESVYNGEWRNGYFYENYKFLKGTRVIIADAYINAKNEIFAIKKLAKALGWFTTSEAIKSDIEDGYYTIEEANYYDEETDTHFKYYVSTIYPKEEETKWKNIQRQHLKTSLKM